MLHIGSEYCFRKFQQCRLFSPSLAAFRVSGNKLYKMLQQKMKCKAQCKFLECLFCYAALCCRRTFFVKAFQPINIHTFLSSQEEVLHESEQMIPDCERRLIKAWDELSKIVVSLIFYSLQKPSGVFSSSLLQTSYKKS